MRAALLTLTCLLAACTTNAVAPASPDQINAWSLLTPASLGATRSAQQRLQAMYGEREIVLDCVVEVTPERIQVVGLLPGATRVFSVSYDGKQLQSQASPMVPAAFRPESLLTDLQLAFWPLAALNDAVNDHWTITEPDTRTRRLLYRGRLFAEVHRSSENPWEGRLWLVNFARGYSLNIDSRPLD